jgi:hypothetical protein
LRVSSSRVGKRQAGVAAMLEAALAQLMTAVATSSVRDGKTLPQQ